MESLTVAEARENLSELLNRAAYAKERIIVVRHNKKIAALVPIEDLERLEALEDKIDLAEAKKILSHPKPPLPWKEVKAEIKAHRVKRRKARA